MTRSLLDAIYHLGRVHRFFVGVGEFDASLELCQRGYERCVSCLVFIVDVFHRDNVEICQRKCKAFVEELKLFPFFYVLFSLLVTPNLTPKVEG